MHRTNVSDEESDSDEESEDGNGKARAESDDEGEHEFEMEGPEHSPRGNTGGDNDDDDYADDLQDSDEEDEGGRKGSKRQKTRRSEEDPASDAEEGGKGGKSKEQGQGGTDAENQLDTTAATADLTMMTSQGDVDNLNATTSQPTFRELHRQRRNRIRLHYSAGSYHASPSSWTAYTLCSQLRFGNVADLLWLACVGVTDAYIHGRLDVSGYSALCVDLKRHVGRLFPNEMVDRVGRAVYAEELEELSYGGNQADAAGGGMGQPMTQIGLSENGRILSQSEYKFMLLRHTSLWDSLLHSNFVASKFQVWRGEGKQKLMELLAKMGFPLDSCRQPWAFVGVGLRRRLRERIDGCTEVSQALYVLKVLWIRGLFVCHLRH